jgi:hypothetical protein
VLLFFLLLAASVSIRQETRWLYSPYVVLVLGLAYVAGRIPAHKRLATLAPILLAVSAVSVEGFYRRSIGNLYFFSALTISDTAKRKIIDRYGPELSRREVYFVTHGDSVPESWIFHGDDFFRLYGKDSAIHVHYVDSLDRLTPSPEEVSRMLIFILHKGKVRDISKRAVELVSNRGKGRMH